MIKSSTFAAFIMTYQRNSTLESTIHDLLEQTFPPQKILIIDNDPDQGASVVAEKLSNLPVAYHAVGYNSGPAGAAKKGLEILSNEGYDWIGWIDDDDPPLFKDTFEILFQRASEIKNCGCAGAVGQRFDISKAMMVRVPDEELEKVGIVYVDNVAGGMCKIVNADVVKKHNILPDEKLFYGFEELDFDLRVKKVGYALIADAQLYKRNRIHHNRIGFKVKRGQKKVTDRLWREYYSTRNLLIILHKQHAITSLILFLLRSFLKSVIGIRYGLNYGSKNFRYINLGILHFIAGRKGKL
jgi:GT2 family glycosyltransferase